MVRITKQRLCMPQDEAISGRGSTLLLLRSGRCTAHRARKTPPVSTRHIFYKMPYRLVIFFIKESSCSYRQLIFFIKESKRRYCHVIIFYKKATSTKSVPTLAPISCWWSDNNERKKGKRRGKGRKKKGKKKEKRDGKDCKESRCRL